MFYSHNLLARKGPLGTVWCAAHLQNKLKKSNYITVNIQSTVEQIMNPQVPIALRMSGHLLLGVVRIYSKKVEYLQHDYNILRIDISKAYAYADINLPEDANQAKFDSITLPDKFSLDLMDVDDYDPYVTPDAHLRRHEDISLQDHRDLIPPGYIEFTFAEDASIHSSPSLNDPGSMPLPNEEDLSIPITPPQTIPAVQDPDFNHNHQNQSSPEWLRNVTQTSSAVFTLPDRVEPDLELVNQLSNEINNSFPTMNDEMLETEGLISPPKQKSPPKQTPSRDLTLLEPTNDNSDQPLMYVVNSSPPVKPPQPVEPPALAPPAPAAEQPRAKRRKIKYDKATVLSNRIMKKSLEDCSDLKRKRRGACTSLDVWRVNNSRKGEKVLFASIITGLCDNLCEVFEGDLMSKRARKICMEEAPVTHTKEADNDDMECEHERENVGSIDNDVIPEMSPDHGGFSSPCPNDENTPAISTSMGSQSNPAQTTIGTGMEYTPGPTSSIGSGASEMGTSGMFSQGFDNNGGLPDIPEGDDDDDLAFIEDDEGSTSIGLKGTPQSEYSSGKQRSPPEIGSLLARTKAVAQYIKEKASATPSTPTNVGSVSMSSILEGKKRKVCSRMFYETLVLKSCDLIDVKQDEPYGDIVLKVTSKLAKHQFLN